MLRDYSYLNYIPKSIKILPYAYDMCKMGVDGMVVEVHFLSFDLSCLKSDKFLIFSTLAWGG